MHEENIITIVVVCTASLRASIYQISLILQIHLRNYEAYIGSRSTVQTHVYCITKNQYKVGLQFGTHAHCLMK